MSARIKTFMPLIDHELVLKALNNLGESYHIQGTEIILTSRSNSFYTAKLEKNNSERYLLIGDSYLVNGHFQTALVNEYRKLYNEKMERIRQELIRQEQLRLQAIEEEKKRQLEAERVRLEQERLRLEEERKRYVESQKQKIYERAKKMGYSVKETTEGEQVKMVLVKRIY